MTASLQDIEGWYEEAKRRGAAYLIIVCDTFDYDNYPVYVQKVEDFQAAFNQYQKPQNMSSIDEVYDMKMPMNQQRMKPSFLGSARCWSVPVSEESA